MQAQGVEPTYEAYNDLIKVTFYHTNGKIKETGFYDKNKELTGKWIQYDVAGNKTVVAHYKEGKKVGKWTIYEKNSVRKIVYNNNNIISSTLKGNDSNLAKK